MHSGEMDIYGTVRFGQIDWGLGMAVNRLPDWFRAKGDDGAFLSMSRTQFGIAVADTPLAKVFARALEERWSNRPKSQLANAAKLSIKSIDRILTGGTTKATKAVTRLCAVLGINAVAAERGEYVLIGTAADRDIHKQLDTILESTHGDTLRLQIESLYHLIANAADHRKR